MKSINKRIEISALREIVAQVEASPKVRAFCIIPCGDVVADERAYWLAVRLNAKRYGFWVVNDSTALRFIDNQFKYISKWIYNHSELHDTNVIKIDAKKLFLHVEP